MPVLFQKHRLLAVLPILLLSGILLAESLIFLRRPESTSPAKAAPDAVCVYAPADPLYILRECGEKIGIFDPATDVLLGFVDVFVSTLPENDRTALRNGLAVYSFSELSERIEDFRS